MLKTKNKHLRYVITFFAVLCSSLLQTFVIESFVHSAGLLSGGFTGRHRFTAGPSPLLSHWWR